MTRNESREKTITELLNRILYLESVVFGSAPAENGAIFDQRIVHIVRASEGERIFGVFLDEKEAHALASMHADDNQPCVVEPWTIQAAVNEFVPAQTIPFGSKVTYLGGAGTIVNSDYDLSQGLQKVLYTILPEGLSDERDSYIFLFHSEINGVENDAEKE